MSTVLAPLLNFGAIGILAILLWFQLGQAREERIKIQEQHNITMEKQSNTYADMVKEGTKATMEAAMSTREAATAMHELAASVKELSTTQVQERKEVLEEIRRAVKGNGR